MKRIDVLKNKMNNGSLVKGVFITMSEPVSSEIAGYLGYDYVWIDAEHGALDKQEILNHIRCAQGAGCCAFVRIAEVNPGYIKGILDMGPDGIIFPLVHNEEIAKLAVASCSYPDDDYNGIRGQGPIRAIRYGIDDENDYLKNAYSSVLKIFQIESMEGYKNLDKIIEVHGVDSIFIGGADLSRSFKGAGREAMLDEAITHICKQTKKANLLLGTAIGASYQEGEKAVNRGVDYVVFGQDVRALAAGLKSNLEQLKDW